ncbi:hypothetical protein G3I20_18745 [Streptomyces sp. SID8111]|uniref:hypothetical protein n=1 Tax=Streptomyces sp. SID8111 TaxID=2706100 RepID=UPI0013BF4D34|nr:hypothetical protein [Streptomyces sp. SID8111]NEB59731.1 hypothetical protein [Streptomyces diastaticus]NEC28555.1 hypothetical protein [Streptomyces sp. SID8111]
MGRRATKKAAPKATRERRPARRLQGVDPRVLAGKLYELHARAERRGDQGYLERWPGDGETHGVLHFAQAHADRLEGEAYQQAALLRITLAEWLRQQADPLQLRALDDARGAGVQWDQVALALQYTNADGEPNPSSAFNRHASLKVAVLGRPEDRRQPHVARIIEARAAQEELERRERERAEDARYPAMDAAARALLEHFEAGEILSDPDDDFWWSELADVVDDRRDASERANLVVYVRGVVRETYAHARRTGEPPATTERARQALEEAAALVDPSTSEGDR